jgi:hypothetical protein
MTFKGIIPSQYVARWTSEDGVKLRIFQYVDVNTWDLVKVFVESKTFDELGLARIIKQCDGTPYEMTFEQHPVTGREMLIGIRKATT